MSTTETGRSPLAAIGLDEQRWAANRLAGLDATERRLYAHILRSFADGAPERLDAVDRSQPALRALVGRDLVGLDGSGRVAVAYPFSAAPTRHRVSLDDGHAYWAMCAVDALGIPDMLGRPAQITARDPDSEQPVTVDLEPGGPPRWTPAEAVVVAAASGSGCSSACACPHINLFASPVAAERYLARPELHGTILTIPEATAAGRRLFGDLLDRLQDTDAT